MEKDGCHIICEEVSLEMMGKMIIYPTDFSISPHERIILEGPSGAGKTTLLRLLSGLIVPSGGKVKYVDHGKNLETKDRVFESFRSDFINITFAEPLFFEQLTFEENLLFPAFFLGLKYSQGWKEKIIDTLELEKILHARVDTLSSGERDRLSISRALLYDKPTLFLDEPGAHLDRLLFAKMKGILSEYLLRVKPTTLIISHSEGLHELVDSTYICEGGHVFLYA